MTDRVKIIETEDLVVDATAVGNIATYSGGPLTVSGDLDPKQTKKRNKKRKNNNSLGGSNDNTLSKFEGRDVEQMLESMVLENLTELIVEQNDPAEVMALFDNIVKVIGLSFNYTRAFMSDGLKLDDKTLKFGMKRAKAELNRVTGLIQHLDQLLIKIYQAQQAAQKQVELDRVPTTGSESSDGRTLKEGPKRTIAQNMKSRIRSAHALQRKMVGQKVFKFASKIEREKYRKAADEDSENLNKAIDDRHMDVAGHSGRSQARLKTLAIKMGGKEVVYGQQNELVFGLNNLVDKETK